MNIIEKVKALLAINTFFNKERALIMDMPNIKAGIFTTQFWISAVPAAVALWGQIQGFIPQPYGTYITLGATSLYVIARTLHVAWVQIQAIKAQTPQPTTVTTTQPTTTVTTPA